MKIKIFVGIALVIFILAVGSILAFGLIQKNPKADTGTVIKTPDVTAIVDNKKNTQQSVASAAANATNNPTSTNTNTQQQPAQITQPSQPPPVVTPPMVRRRITRAS